MRNGIIIIGIGAQSQYALEIFHLINQPVIGLIALPDQITSNRLNSGKLLGYFNEFENIYIQKGRPSLILAISDNSVKESIEKKIAEYAPHYVNVIHPKAVIASTAKLGVGIIINAGAIIQPHARIGDHVMIHAGVIVEHDCIVMNFVNLAPRSTLTGHVKVGKGTTVYSGVVVIPTIEIGDYAKIGAGGIVTRNVEDRTTVVGIPSRKLEPSDHDKV